MSTDFSAAYAGGTKPVHALIVAMAALFTDTLLAGLAAPILPLLPAVVNAGPTWTGILFSSYAVSMVIATLLTGRVVDRYGPKTPLLVGLVGMGLATFLFAIGQPFWLLLIARMAQGVSGGISWVAALALIAATTPIERRGRAMGLAISATSLGFLVGPPLAGIMATNWGTASPFILAGLVAIGDGILRVVLIKDAALPDDDTGGPRAVLAVAGSWSIVLVVMIGAALPAAIQPLLPQHLHIDEFTVGLLYSAMGVAVIIFNPIAGSLVGRVRVQWLVGFGVLVGAGALLILANSQALLPGTVATVLIGISGCFALTPATTLISNQGQRANPPTLGGSFSLNNLAYAAGLAIGPLLSTIGVHDGHYQMGLWVTCGVLTLVGLVALPGLPDIKPQDQSQSLNQSQDQPQDQPQEG